MSRTTFALAVLASVMTVITAPVLAAGPAVDQQGWEARKQAVTLPNGVRLAYIEAGRRDGPPLLLLHGFTDSSRIWTAVLPYLSDNRVLMPDQRGHGASDAPQCCYSLSVLADDARLFLDAMKVERAAVIGHSLGSMVGQVLAAEQPGRIDRLVLAASTARAPVTRGDWLWSRTTGPLNPPARNAEFMKEWSIGASPTPVDAELVRYWDADVARIRDHVWRAIPRELVDVPIGRFAPDVKARVAILSASADPLFDAPHHASLVAAYPAAKAQVLEGLGHNFIVERPEIVGPALARALKD